jgi:hypothetical protein
MLIEERKTERKKWLIGTATLASETLNCSTRTFFQLLVNLIESRKTPRFLKVFSKGYARNIEGEGHIRILT